MDNIIGWLTKGENWLVISGILWWVDAGLKIIAPLTKTTIDDNVADIFGKLLAKFFRKG